MMRVWVTLMYLLSLSAILWLQDFLDQQENKCPNDLSIAQRILTLPIYTNVSNKIIEQFATILKQNL